MLNNQINMGQTFRHHFFDLPDLSNTTTLNPLSCNIQANNL